MPPPPSPQMQNIRRKISRAGDNDPSLRYYSCDMPTTHRDATPNLKLAGKFWTNDTNLGVMSLKRILSFFLVTEPLENLGRAIYGTLKNANVWKEGQGKNSNQRRQRRNRECR